MHWQIEFLSLIYENVSENLYERTNYEHYMSNDIIISLLALVGTLSGTFGGILTSSKLTAYRIRKLEEKVDMHNNFAQSIPIIEEKIKVINHRIEDLERGKEHEI